MINLMIVDDEERARLGIRRLIDWESHGVSIVGEAADGAEALDLMRLTPVDILLTDIRMPVMDGLRLIEQVAVEYPHVKCVIMSGFDEFSYARKAMALGAKDYLLKPSRRQEILDMVLKLIADIEEERLQSRNLENLKHGFRESIPLLKEKTLSRLVLAEDQPYNRLLDTLHMNGLDFPYLFFGTVVLQIDNFQALQQKYTNEDIELYKYGLKNITEEVLSEFFHCVAFEYQDIIIAILNTEEWLSIEDLTPHVETVQQSVNSYLKFSVSVGIGSFDKQVTHIRNSYMEALKALETRYFLGEGKIVGFMDAVDDDSQTSYPLKEEKAILQAVISGDGTEIRTRLNEFHRALKPESTSKDHVLKSTFAFLFALYRFCIEKNLNTNEVFGHNLTELTHILAHSSTDYILQALSETLLRISEQLNAKKNSNKLFQSALDYIELNYRKDISRETVASEVYITPGYLSLLFKQNLKTNFLEYLHKIRIEQACIRLRDKGLRIGDIAHEVGYNDEKYFFQVFKKYTGMTPNQFRSYLDSAKEIEK